MLKTASEYSKWIKFFKDASIPPEYVETYAKKFAENRIRFDLLADLDRPLLNEMGITAIGDCLSILKHAKSISSKLTESNKTVNKELTPAIESLNQIEVPQVKVKKTEIAKRIIENCLSRSPNQSESESPKTTTLSADLFSRLNFNPTAITPVQKVTFNEDSLNQAAKCVMVTSTTNDDEAEVRQSIHLGQKRKLDQSKDTVLEYRGFLKNNPDVIEPNLSGKDPKRVLSLNETLRLKKTPIKRCISVHASSVTVGQTATSIRMNKFSTLKSDQVNQPVFKRIKVPGDRKSVV